MQEQKKAEIHKSLSKMVNQLESQSRKGQKLDQVEGDLFMSLLRLGYELLSYYIYLVQKRLDAGVPPLDSDGSKLRNKGYSSRKYRSIFGELSLTRRKYIAHSGKSHYELDVALGLPRDRYSYVLMDWLGYGAVEMDFDQSVSLLSRILNQTLLPMQSSRKTYELSREVESYYDSKVCPSDGDCTHLSVGFDGKGVPIRRSETERASESVSTRLSKGAKKGVKKEATVSVSSSFIARKRSAAEILDALFEPTKEAPAAKKPERPWHENKHIRAFLSDKSGAINYGIEQLLKRDPTGKKPIVVLIDGDRSLEKTTQELMAEKGIEDRVQAYILDFIHLLEYVWKVANAHLGEKNPEREAWVKAQAQLLLDSQHQEVIQQWTKLQEGGLSENKQQQIQKSITYLSNRPHMLDYKTFLEKGFPITTGAVESACGHFVKSRMERNAMHWGKKGAQKMLNMRAIKKNQDWEAYLEYFIKNEQNILYQQAA